MRQAGRVIEDPDRCYLAVQSRDPRFDGWFFTAVLTTGIYCRPSCPARTPHRENVVFYPTAAAAQLAGFRACKRCRPNASPGSPEWDARADVVARAMRLIADGAVDRDGVGGLAASLGYSVRQLERVLLAEVGAGPIALARAQRAQTARVLIETTALPMSNVAFAAGFASIRQFNDTVRDVFGMSPTELRSRIARVDKKRGPVPTSLSLRLPFRQPLCPDNLFGHLAATAVPGVEEVRNGTYRRTLRLGHGPAIVELTPTPDHVACTLVLSDLRDLTTGIARCRWLLDLDADPEAIDERLASDRVLAPLIAKAPGRRVPRCIDGAELAIRCGARPTGLDGRGTHRRRTARRALRRGGAGPPGWSLPAVPHSGGASRLPRRTRRRPPPKPHRARLGARRRCARGGTRMRPGRDARDARETSRRRPLDGADGRDAGPRRPRRLPTDRPRCPSWCRIPRSSACCGTHGTRRTVASLARLCRPAPVGHRRASDQPVATDRSPSSKKERSSMTLTSTATVTTTVDSPIGPLTLTASDGFLTGLSMHEQRHAPRVSAECGPRRRLVRSCNRATRRVLLRRLD